MVLHLCRTFRSRSSCSSHLGRSCSQGAELLAATEMHSTLQLLVFARIQPNPSLYPLTILCSRSGPTFVTFELQPCALHPLNSIFDYFCTMASLTRTAALRLAKSSSTLRPTLSPLATSKPVRAVRALQHQHVRALSSRRASSIDTDRVSMAAPSHGEGNHLLHRAPSSYLAWPDERQLWAAEVCSNATIRTC